MNLYLRLEADDGQGVTLIDDNIPPTPLDPVVLVGVDWGNAAWEAAYSGPRGTLGRAAVQTQVSDRTVTLPIRFYGQSIDDLAGRVAAFTRVVDAIRRSGGGRLIRRAHTGSVKASLRITATTGVSAGAWTARSETVPRRDVTVGFTCAPFWLGECMDVDVEPVTGADTSRWTYYPTSPPGTITLTATGLQRTGSAADLVILPDTYRTVDHQVTAVFVAGGNASQAYGCVGRWIDQNNHVRGRLIGTVLTVSAIIGGSTLYTGTASVTAPATGQRFAVRLTVHSDGARVDYFADANQLVDAAAPTQTAVTTNGGPVGDLVPGRPGVLFNSNNLNDQARVAAVQVRPHTIDYTGTLPAVIPLRRVPGDVPALADLQITARQPFEFGLVGWRQSPAAGVINLIDDGEAFGSAPVSKWTITGGATVAKQTTGGRTGTDHIQVTFSTSNPSGVQRIFAQSAYMKWPRRQRTVECWVRSAASTAPVRLTAGGQTATVNLSTTWQKLAVTFIDTAGGNLTVAVEKTGTSSGVFQLDDIHLYDGAVSTSQKTNAAPPPFGVLQAANVPNAGVSTVDASCYTEPSFLVDGGAGGDLVEVWGRTALHSSLTAARAKVRVRHESGIGAADYALETGELGRPLLLSGSTRMTLNRYGTVRLPAGRSVIEPRFSYSGTGTTIVSGAPSANATPSGFSGWSSPGNAALDDGSFVSCPQDSVFRYTDFTCAVTVPGGSVIGQIQIRITKPTTSTLWSGVDGITVWLTTDNFATVTPSQMMVLDTYEPLYYVLGGMWGREWTVADLTNLKVRLRGMEAKFDQLRVDVVYTPNPPAVESLILVPARGRAVTPTGVARPKWATYPGAEYRKTIAADLAGRTELVTPEASGYQVTPGMGGSLIELPPGDVDAVVKLSPVVPDGPDSVSSADPATTTDTAIHFAVTPRWTVLREGV